MYVIAFGKPFKRHQNPRNSMRDNKIRTFSIMEIDLHVQGNSSGTT